MSAQASAKTMNCRDSFAYASACSSEERSSKSFLVTLFSALDSGHVRYCVLHSWEELPEKLSSDLDIAVHPQDIRKLPFVLRTLREQGYTPVQVFNYFVNAYYFVFFWFEGEEISSAAVDIILEHRRGGLVVPSGEDLVAGRRRQGMFWIPAPESEFTYLLAKKTWKGKAPARQGLRLKALVEQLGTSTAEKCAAEIFLGQLKIRAIQACASGRIDAFLSQVRNQTWKVSLVRNPFRLATYLLSDGVRRVRRYVQATGLFVVLIGPDGSGKSTLISQLIEVVGPAFRRQRVFHWRPMLLWRRKTTGDVTQPHSRPEHAGWWSVARLFAHLLDYWFGYLVVIRPLLARSGLVLFDRYFYDMLIDPKRYRYGGSSWVMQFLRPLVPKPDLILVLDAPVEVILSRKREVAPEEVERQRRLYATYKNEPSSVRVIDATGSVPQVTAESAGAIIQCLAQRFEHRHAGWLSCTQD